MGKVSIGIDFSEKAQWCVPPKNVAPGTIPGAILLDTDVSASVCCALI